jgi:predicted porin
MKKFNLSLAALLAMSTFAIAGGDIAPVEPVVEVVEEPIVDDSGFYLGLAYSATSIDIDGVDTINIGGDEDADAFLVQLGYKFNSYFALEGRYWNGDNDFDAWGLYAKPMYPVTDAFDVYALLGYGNAGAAHSGVDFDNSEFQWGLGAAYSFTDHFAVFFDYVELADGDNIGIYTNDWSVDNWNFGFTYQF